MKLSVSNIAWHSAIDPIFFSMVEENKFSHIDLAPSMIWPGWNDDVESGNHFSQLLERHNLTPWGMQSLFYGTEGLNVFSQGKQWQLCVSHMRKVAEIANAFNVKRVVFGSPLNRDPQKISANNIFDIAKDKFIELADIFKENNTVLCMEPVPEKYGGRFLTNTIEAAEFVREVSHPALKLNLDTGVMFVENESIACTINDCADVIAHVHASEPGLVAFDSPQINHLEVANALLDIHYDDVVALEMRAEPNLESANLSKALIYVEQCYGN